LKIKEILESDLSWEKKFEKAFELWETQSKWLDQQTDIEVMVKYYEKLQETLEGVRHLHCMYKLGYDPTDKPLDIN